MRYAEMTFEAPSDSLDELSGILWEHDTLGLETDDGSEQGRARVRAYFKEGGDIEGLTALLGVLPGITLGGMRLISREDWPENWKQYFVSAPVGSRLLVRPPWEAGQPAAQAGRLEIVIDPGSAFGTGQHATTRLCLERLDERPPEGLSCLDVGTGSGILSIAALKLGARSVTALDCDGEVIENLSRNLELNGIRGLRFVCGTPECLSGRFDVIFANINRVTLVSRARTLLDLGARPHGRIFLSGFLREEIPEVVTAYAAPARSCRTFESEGWGAVEVEL